MRTIPARNEVTNLRERLHPTPMHALRAGMPAIRPLALAVRAGSVTADDLTPEERVAVQEYFLVFPLRARS